MSARRLLLTAAAMTGIAGILGVLAPAPGAVLDALTAPQTLADTAGPGVLVLTVAGGLAWLAWAWGAVGLLLTAAGALPGAAGWAARLLQRAVLPAGARRAAAVALGFGMALQGPLSATAFASTGATSPATASTATAAAGPVVPDWPTAPPQSTGSPGSTASTERPASPESPRPAAPGEQPGEAPAATHVVAPGDCLWDIASDHLRTASGRPPTAADIAVAVSDWWSQNRAAIGNNPDLLTPGQVLSPPTAP